jgi:cell division protein FtsI (penicillin-binding protein 3)
MGIKKSIVIRVQVAFTFCLLFACAVMYQAAKVVYVEGDYYRAKADSSYIKYQPVPAERGNIYASDGSLLAASIPSYIVAMDPLSPSREDFFDNIDSLSYSLAQMLGDRTAGEYRRMLISARESGRRYVVLDQKASFPDLQKMRAFPLFNLGRFRGGLVFEEKSSRERPYGVLAHRTIGYITDEVHVGIEGAFNTELSGLDGKRLSRKLAGGHWLPITDQDAIEPQDGLDIVSTLDVGIQDVAEAALENALLEHDAQYGCAVVMEVGTGKIRAMANLAKIGEGKYDEIYNYAVGDNIEPGSTFKLASAMALFEDGHCNELEKVDLNNGKCRFKDRTMRDSEGWHKYREVDLAFAFAKSSNVGISKLVYRYYRNNPSAFVDRIKSFGLADKSGICIPGEPQPYLRDPSDRNSWFGTTLPWMSVGYSLQMTPLQMLTFYNAVANDGKMMAPQLVEKTLSHGQLVQSFEPVVRYEKIASEQTIQKVQDMLKMVVDTGTARRLHSDYYSFSGKTGTSLIANDRISYADKVYQASFAGYFPSENPMYSVIVVVNAPSKGDIYGAKVAGPVFRAIADRIYSSGLEIHDPVNQMANKSVAPKAKGFRQDIEQCYTALEWAAPIEAEFDWVLAKNDGEKWLVEGMDFPGEGRIPDVYGMGLRDALYLLENRGWEVEYEGLGKVKIIKREGQTVHLTLG